VRGVAWGAALLTLVGVSLMVLGALVRAHGAGLACPDWPLCFGQLIPQFNFKVFFEYAHRALAGLVTLSLAALSWAIWRQPALWAGARGPLLAAWAVLAVQVVLGGLTVLLLLAPWTVTAHLLGGTSFCAALLWTTRNLFEHGRPVTRTALPPAAARAVALCALLLLGQLVLGGLVSSQGAGLACPDFPRCAGPLWVPSLSGLVGLHVLHRANALALLAALGALAWFARGLPRVGTLTRFALRLALLQAAVGAWNVVARLPVEITALHSALAAALSLVLVLLARELVLGLRASAARTALPVARSLERPAAVHSAAPSRTAGARAEH
jgi:cytochrome c oxidase assembly protein subunit 15